jgi:hypothetical protein
MLKLAMGFTGKTRSSDLYSLPQPRPSPPPVPPEIHHTHSFPILVPSFLSITIADENIKNSKYASGSKH